MNNIDANRSVTTGAAPNALDAFKQQVKGFFAPGNAGEQKNQRTTDPTQARLLDIFDVDVVSGPLVTLMGLNHDAIEASEALIRPALFFTQVAGGTTVANRFSINPVAVAFNSSSAVTIGGTAYSSVQASFTGGAASNCIGYVFKCEATDTQSGSSTFSVAFEEADTSFGFSLADVSQPGFAFVWAHAIANKLPVTQTLSVVDTTATLTSAATATSVTDTYVARPLVSAITITGTNAIIKLYPVYATDPVNEVLLYHIMTDNLAGFGASVLRDYAGQ